MRFAFATEVFLAVLHRAITWRYGHRAELDTIIASLAELLTQVEGTFDVAFLTAPDKADGFCLPEFSAGADTASAEDTVVVPEGITNVFNATANGDVLDSTGVRRLGNEQLGNVVAEALDTLLRGKYWLDAAYVAERVLTLDELRQYVDRYWAVPPRPDWQPGGDHMVSMVISDHRFMIRYLLGRRLARAGRWEDACTYMPARLLPHVDAYVVSVAKSRVDHERALIRLDASDAIDGDSVDVTCDLTPATGETLKAKVTVNIKA